MASASTSTAVNSTTNSCYEIFLNHRGPDTKNTFASHLYRRLVLHGFRVFWDKEEMQVGDTLTSQIQEAIKTASLHVAIFSPRYAESSWCLDELHLMVKSGKPIIPVFYHIQPGELRRTQGEGVYAEALRNLEKKRTHDSQPRYDFSTIGNWRAALSTVADISGLELEKFNRDEGELVDEVVYSASQKLKKHRFDVAEHPVGLDEKIKDFENKVSWVKLQQSGKPQVVGIVGMGGTGKTTLVKELFNRKRSQYMISCFLFDVRENARKASLESLQKKLLESWGRRDEKIESVSEGIELLKTRFSNNMALVILDDVDNVNQLDALLRPIRDARNSWSLILITSRDKDVLTRSKVEESSIYKLTGLNPRQSHELFCLHAFAQRHPLPGFEGLIDKYLKACNGLPLSLKVFGALLYGNDDKSFWKDNLERLEQILPEDIQKSLQISYDALQIDEKQIFLDIACFFIGESRDKAIRIWDGCGWKGSLGFRSLQNKNLVEVDTGVSFYDRVENRIRMHDHLRDLGRDLAKDPRLPRRIWRTEDFEDLLQQSSVVTAVRGISMRWTKNDPSFLLCKMRNLQFLDMGYDFPVNLLESIMNAVQSPNLIWIRSYYCGYSSLFSRIPLTKLRVLEVRDGFLNLQTLWQESQAPLQLRELEIEAHLIPKSIGLLKHLERIVIYADPSFEKLPEEVFNLLSLKYLKIRASGISSLPDSFGNLTNLRHLDLSFALHLKRLPDSFGNLTNLQHINLSRCIELKQLPDIFENLTGLTYLDLSGCSGLTMSSETHRNINKIESIHLPFHLDYVHCVPIMRPLARITRARSPRKGDNGSTRLQCPSTTAKKMHRLHSLPLYCCALLSTFLILVLIYFYGPREPQSPSI